MNLPSLVGVVHLPALAGAPGSHGLSPHQALERAGLQAVREARALRAAGFEAVILENFGDIPFYKTRVPAETIASMAVISAAVREGAGLPVGLNFLRNDGRSALAVASVTGAQFIRVNVLSGVAATDQGIIEGDAAELIRERERLHSDVAILADVHVKHARSLSSEDIALAVEEVAQRAMAEGVVVSGATTGRSVDPRELERASEAARSCRVPLYIGSGATPETLSELCRYASGIIVSSALRKGGVPGAALDLARATKFAREYHRVRKSSGKKKKKGTRKGK